MFLIIPVSSVAKDPSPIEVNFHPFSNGLGLYHFRLEEATNFKLSATVWVGSVNEDPAENAGVSHLLEHILFHQPDVPETEFDAQIKSRGGTLNGRTSTDYTKYFVTLPARHLELGQSWLYKVLFHDRLVTDRLEKEKEMVSRENQWSTPTWWETVLNLFDPELVELPGFWGGNFGLWEYDLHPAGTYGTISGLTAAKLEAHYRAYYYPENMVLLYVGPHELDEVVAVLGPTFGSVPRTGRKAQVAPILKDVSPPPYFRHDLPDFFSAPEYHIWIGHVFTELRFPQDSELILYHSVMKQLLEERLRYREGKIYSVSRFFDLYRGAGRFQLGVHANSDTYWTVLEDAKKLVWGDLGEYLSQKDYERYKTELLERIDSNREFDQVHTLIWQAIEQHPFHRPSPEETDRYGPLRSLSYRDFLAWVRTWRSKSPPLLELSMPAFPFPYSHLLLFLLAMAFGANLFTMASPWRRFPRENIKLMTRVPYGIAGWIQLGVLYVVAGLVALALASLVSLLIKEIGSGTLFVTRINALAMVYPYLESTFDGLSVGLVIAIGGLAMPRKVLVTDGALVLKMRSPNFYRIPITDIAGVERVYGWVAWMKVLSFKALPVYPWFLRGLLIHRKSSRSLVLRTKDDVVLQKLLTSPIETQAAVSTLTLASTAGTRA